MSKVVEAIRNTVAENFGNDAQKIAKPEHQFSISEVPDVSGKVAVITGGTEGIGHAVAHTLLSRNLAHLHLLSPSREVADSALAEFKTDFGDDVTSRVTWHQVDLADWKATQSIAEEIAKSSDRIDIVVGNSARGIMTYQIAEQSGIDRHMAVNHFAHVILTTTLLPKMKETAAKGETVRVSFQASNAHQGTPSDTKFASVDELNSDLGANGQYGRSKLANMLYARYLTRHLKSDGPGKILVNCTHPGFVESEMSTRDIHEPFPVLGYAMSGLMKPLKKTQWEGAVPTLFAVTKTESSGNYYCPPAVPEPGNKLSQDEELGERLMKLTREILGDKMGTGSWKDY